MQHALRPLTVVGEEQQTARVRIEPADGKEAPRLADQFADRAPALRIAHGADHAERLVQHEVASTNSGRHDAAVDLDPCIARHASA